MNGGIFVAPDNAKCLMFPVKSASFHYIISNITQWQSASIIVWNHLFFSLRIMNICILVPLLSWA